MSLTAFTEAELEALEHKWTLPRFVFFPAGLVGLWSIGHPWPAAHGGIVFCWQLYTAYIFFCWTSCFHETAHQTLSGSQRVSIWLGRILGCLIGVPYTVYRESHIRHHAYLNTPSDWELWPYSDPQASLGFRRAFVWCDLLCGGLTAPYIYGRIFFHRDSPIKSSVVRRRIRWEYAALIGFWGLVLGGVAWTNQWTSFCMVWIVPHLLAGIYQSFRKLTEHLGMASYDPLLGTRTVIGDNLFTRVCTYMNFDIFVHGPHHRHPRIAHDQLRTKMHEYVSENPELNYPIYSSYRQASFAMIPWLFRNPGVGMNVGAHAPALDADSADQIRVDDPRAESDRMDDGPATLDFVADVTQSYPAVANGTPRRRAA